jgi:hypothetical protein
MLYCSAAGDLFSQAIELVREEKKLSMYNLCPGPSIVFVECFTIVCVCVAVMCAFTHALSFPK